MKWSSVTVARSWLLSSANPTPDRGTRQTLWARPASAAWHARRTRQHARQVEPQRAGGTGVRHCLQQRQ